MDRLLDWIEIFRTGQHVDSSGQEVDWTLQDLQDIVSNFSPKSFSVPVKIGHSDSDRTPAHGWVTELKISGQSLYAKLSNLSEVFLKYFRNFQIPNRSVSIHLTDHGPVLNHLAFLGAAPPALDLEPLLEFRANHSNPPVRVLSYVIPPQYALTSILGDPLMNIHDFAAPPPFKKKEEVKATDSKEPSSPGDKNTDASDSVPMESQYVAPEAIPTPAPAQPAPTPPPTPAPISSPPMPPFPKAELEALINQSLETAMQGIMASAQAYVSQLVQSGRLPATQLLEGLKSFICLLDSYESTSARPLFEFSANRGLRTQRPQWVEYVTPDGTKVQQSPSQFLRTFLESLPVSLDVGKQSRHDYTAAKGDRFFSTSPQGQLHGQGDMQHIVAAIQSGFKNPLTSYHVQPK